MKFSRHENFANLAFWPILTPNSCIFPHRGGCHLKRAIFHSTPLGYPLVKFTKISCTRALHVEDLDGKGAKCLPVVDSCLPPALAEEETFSFPSVCLSVWVCESYLVHHFVGTILYNSADMSIPVLAHPY